MIIRRALVYGENREFEENDIYVINDRFVTKEDYGKIKGYGEDDEIVDGRGLYAIPGLIDIHFHGAMGYDICDGTREAYEKVAAYEAANGITAICPATLTLSVDELENVLSIGAAFAEENKNGALADLVGFNMEGPFISHSKKGAQNENFIRPCNMEDTDKFVKASKGLVKIIGLAPEENPGFEDFISRAKNMVRISLAHSNANYDVATKAIRAGVSHGVHLYNAMSGLTHREPGIVGALSDSKSANAELICDGIHVHPGAVRAAFRMMGEDRIVFISDSLRSTGMPDGKYDLGGQEVEKKGNECRLTDGGNLAGSVTNLADCMRYAVKHMEVPLETAIACATINAARSIGVEEDYGSIAARKKANFLLLSMDEDLTLKAVYKDGVKIR